MLGNASSVGIFHTVALFKTYISNQNLYPHFLSRDEGTAFYHSGRTLQYKMAHKELSVDWPACVCYII